MAGDDEGLIVMEVLALLKIIYKSIFVIIVINNNEKLPRLKTFQFVYKNRFFFSIFTGCGDNFNIFLTVLNWNLFKMLDVHGCTDFDQLFRQNFC